MHALARLKDATKHNILTAPSLMFPVWWKEFTELAYWKNRKGKEGVLANDHYQYFYTTHFGLNESDYADKIVLDIGCGPRGSLEWASDAKRRIGLDPLADKFLRLGAHQHQMEYIAAPSEKIPLEDGLCDIVCSFNSLDHVEDVDSTLDEIKRVTSPDGTLLILVEVNHKRTSCEPHRLTPKDLINSLKPEFTCDCVKVYQPLAKGGYQSIIAGIEFADPQETQERGWMSARFRRARSE